MNKLVAAAAIVVLVGVAAGVLVANDENASISPQARAMLSLLPKPVRGEAADVPAPLGVEAAEQSRATMRRLLELPTQFALRSLEVGVSDERIDGVAVKWLTPPSAPDSGREQRVAIYVHGGGYVAGEPLSPLVATLAARDQGLHLPAAVALLSPWTDLTRTGDSYYGNEGRDPLLQWPGLAASAAAYAGQRDPRAPELSPVYADFVPGFPPTLITTGTRDLFLSNCVRLYRTLKRSGVAAQLEVWEGMWHVFESYTSAMPESAEAVETIATFLRQAPAVGAPAARPGTPG